MSIATHERRITRLEANMGSVKEDIAALHDTVYKIERRVTKTEINISLLMSHFGLPSATEEQLDEILERE